MPRKTCLDIPGASNCIRVQRISQSAPFLPEDEKQNFLDRLEGGIAEGHYSLGLCADGITRGIARVEEQGGNKL
jgi:hypothetical protein